MDAPSRRTALLVDQHPLWLDTVAQVIARVGVHTARATPSASEAQDLLDELRPDLLITELSMPEGEPDGLALIRYARESDPELRAIALSMYDDVEHIEAAFEAGALAYVLKKAHPDDLTAAIRQAFDKSIFFATPARSPVAPRAKLADGSRLTRRELEILRLVAQGHSNAQLARMLWVTEQTVKFHLSNVYRKLNVANRTEASHWAQVHGLLDAAAALRVSMA
jgi:DNA-binding NarL/FixJ family response regulator